MERAKLASILLLLLLCVILQLVPVKPPYQKIRMKNVLICYLLKIQNERGEYVKFSSGSDCLDRCNNVIFQDWNDKAYSNELDDDADFVESEAIKSATTMINGEEVCLCDWGDSTVVGCVGYSVSSSPSVSPSSYPTPTSDANSIFITSSFAAGVAVIVASATAIEMACV